TWWVRAQTPSSMRADLVGLGVRLGWVSADEKEAPALAIVMERLRHEGEGILLIYDNAIEPSTLKPYLPRGGAARVLITSNAHAWRGVASPVEIRLWPTASVQTTSSREPAATKSGSPRWHCLKRSAACRSRTSKPRPTANGWRSHSQSIANVCKRRRQSCSIRDATPLPNI